MKRSYKSYLAGILVLLMCVLLTGTVMAEVVEDPIEDAVIEEIIIDEDVLITEVITDPTEESSKEEVIPTEVPEDVPEEVVSEDIPSVEEEETAELPEEIADPVSEEISEMTDEVMVEIQEDVHVHTPVPYEDLEPTIVSYGRTGGTYCSECGEQLTAPSISPMKDLESDLVKGMWSDDVYEMQLLLDELGFMYYGADGYFGTYTEIAVKLFQAEIGFSSQDGEVGYWTLDYLRFYPVHFYNLTYGMDNNAVALMQTYLIDQGFLDSWADGYFGNMTLEAVRSFQMANGLGKSGEADMKMLTILLSGEGKKFETVQRGSQGSTVVFIQNQLLAGGFYDGWVDGDFGGMTEMSVRLFQAYNGYAKPTGVVDDSTYALMNDTYNTFYVLNPGDSGSPVTAMQTALNDFGYLSSGITGIFDEATKEALLEFKKANGLGASETADYRTIYALFNPTSIGVISVNLSLGDTSDEVYAMQTKLCSLGYLNEAPDGYFGYKTYAAVCAFQAAQGYYYPDGVVDSAMYKTILTCNKPFVPVSWDSPSYEVFPLQLLFAEYGMLPGPDGDFGNMTWECVMQIQKMFGLPQTGAADADTIYYIYTFNSHVDNYYNVQGYYSNTNWMIFINSTTNRMYVYNGSIWNWSLVYNWPCSTGTSYTPTVLGEFTTDFSGYSFGDGESYTCYYFTSFYGPYYMHSTLYQPSSWVDNDPRLGLNLSHGCVRLETNNAKWIYYNIPYGTKVVVVK